MNNQEPYPVRTESTDPETAELSGGFVRFKTMVTPSDVLRYGMIGIPKIFPMTNEAIDEDYVAMHLQAAIAEIEMSGMWLSPIITTHIDDWHPGHLNMRYFPVVLKRFPVTKIESIEIMFPNSTTNSPSLSYTIPGDWITFDRTKVNVTPSQGTVSPVIRGSGSSAFPMMGLTSNHWRPSAFKLTYQAGFEQDKLPANVWQYIVDMATYSLISEVGPLLFPTSGVNVSIDGVQQSSQMPGARLFEGRLALLKEKIARNRAVIYGYYAAQIGMEFCGM